MIKVLYLNKHTYIDIYIYSRISNKEKKKKINQKNPINMLNIKTNPSRSALFDKFLPAFLAFNRV